MKRLIISYTFLYIFTTLTAIDYNSLPWIDGTHGSELNIVTKYLPQNPVILEAGGHRGEDTVILAKKWPHGVVYTFEPCPEYFNTLKHRTKGIRNIHAFPFGLSKQGGTYEFYVSQACDGASSLMKDNLMGIEHHLPEKNISYNDKKIQVLCQNLDEWASENNVKTIDYMWLDMEGSEMTMLQGAPNILKTVKALSCEMNFREFRTGMPHFDEFHTFLLENGFSLVAIWGVTYWQSTGVYVRTSLLEN